MFFVCLASNTDISNDVRVAIVTSYERDTIAL